MTQTLEESGKIDAMPIKIVYEKLIESGHHDVDIYEESRGTRWDCDRIAWHNDLFSKTDADEFEYGEKYDDGRHLQKHPLEKKNHLSTRIRGKEKHVGSKDGDGVFECL